MSTLKNKQREFFVNSRLCEWGTSQGVRIPKTMCDATGIAIGERLSIRTGLDEDGAYIVIRPASSEHRSYGGAPCISMDAAFAGYNGDFAPTEFDWGDDVGAEVVS